MYEDGYHTAASFIGIDDDGPWRYYQIAKDISAELGFQVNGGNMQRTDDWSCELGVFTDHDASERTRGGLNFPSHMLSALGNIVKRVAARTDDRFLAGLWEEFSHFNLL